jgi:putative endonuclease
MALHNDIGRMGEDVATKYIVKNGYKILARNDSHPWGEIDIIAKNQKTGLLIFVEVKTLMANDNGYVPEGNYNKAKSFKTRRSCETFANAHPSWYDENIGWRIDVMAVTIKKLPITDPEIDCEINYYENVA